MDYTIIINGRSYDIPKKTLKIAEGIEKVIEIDRSNVSIREKYKAVMNFCQTALGDAAVKEILGTLKIDEADLSEVTLLFEKIAEAYNRPVNEYKADQVAERLASLPLDQLEKVGEVMAKIND